MLQCTLKSHHISPESKLAYFPILVQIVRCEQIVAQREYLSQPVTKVVVNSTELISLNFAKILCDNHRVFRPSNVAVMSGIWRNSCCRPHSKAHRQRCRVGKYNKPLGSSRNLPKPLKTITKSTLPEGLMDAAKAALPLGYVIAH